MPQLDLQPATDRMASLINGVPDDALDRPTPCRDLRLAELINHVGGFAVAFRAAAAKDLGELTSQQPGDPSAELEPGWRARISDDLAALAAAWRSPDAWEGTTQAGSVDLPGEVAGRVVLDELVVHGWDIARASGTPKPAALASGLRREVPQVREVAGVRPPRALVRRRRGRAG